MGILFSKKIVLWILIIEIGCKANNLQPVKSTENSFSNSQKASNLGLEKIEDCIDPASIDLSQLKLTEEKIDASKLQVSTPLIIKHDLKEKGEYLTINFKPIDSTIDENYHGDKGRFKICDEKGMCQEDDILDRDDNGEWKKNIYFDKSYGDSLSIQVFSCVFENRKKTESDCGAPATITNPTPRRISQDLIDLLVQVEAQNKKFDDASVNLKTESDQYLKNSSTANLVDGSQSKIREVALLIANHYNKNPKEIAKIFQSKKFHDMRTQIQNTPSIGLIEVGPQKLCKSKIALNLTTDCRHPDSFDPTKCGDDDYYKSKTILMWTGVGFLVAGVVTLAITYRVYRNRVNAGKANPFNGGVLTGVVMGAISAIAGVIMTPIGATQRDDAYNLVKDQGKDLDKEYLSKMEVITSPLIKVADSLDVLNSRIEAALSEK